MNHSSARVNECGAASLEAAGGRPRGSLAPQASLRAYRTIPDRLRAFAARQPAKAALFDAVATMSYGELDRAVDRVAGAVLDRLGEAPTAVLLLAGVDAPGIVAALGVMRAGKHFVAVEPTFPIARIAEIAQHSAASLVLAGAGHEALARQCAGDACVLPMQAITDSHGGRPLPALAPGAIALLNYTYRTAMSQASRYSTAFLLGDEDRHAGFGSLAWAGSCWDAFGALCVGACAGVYDLRRHGLDALPDWIDRTSASVLSGTVVVRAIARQFPQRRLGGVRLIQLGGDTVFGADVEACRRVFPNAILAVGFGTTETGRAFQHFVAPGGPAPPEVMPIGYPLPGVRAWIVDAGGNEIPPGMVGEIVVHADDLAEGYLGEPGLTAEKFRRDLPCGGAPAYLTGDLGSQVEDGALRHVGRKDFQIKVRGYQVPAGEVEALLRAMPGVREACVVVQGPPAGQEILVAFVVRDAGSDRPAEDLLAPLRRSLPDHMVPQRVVELPALPTTPTGKADRRAMQALPTAAAQPPAGRTAPRTAVEARIAAIWREVLGIEQLGVDEDFLALGGDSLQATQVAGRVLRSFGLDVPLGRLLTRSTVADMAALVQCHLEAGSEPVPITPITRQGNNAPGTPT